MESVFEDDHVVVAGVGPSHLNGDVVGLGPDQKNGLISTLSNFGIKMPTLYEYSKHA